MSKRGSTPLIHALASTHEIRKPKRVYGYRKTPEDRTRCVVTVEDPEAISIYAEHQCKRKRGHGPKGEFCWQHARGRK